jgi:hypothetical protein
MEIANKKSVLHKNSFSKSGVDINNLSNNNILDKNNDSTNKINGSNANLVNNSEILYNNTVI